MTNKLSKKQRNLGLIIGTGLILILLFFSITFWEDKSNILLLILVGLVGWSIGIEIGNYKRRISKKENVFIGYHSIFVYLTIYLVIALVVDWSLFKTSLVKFSLKNLVGCYIFLYFGLKALKYKKSFYWNSPIFGKDAIIEGIISILISILILFARPILIFIGGIN